MSARGHGNTCGVILFENGWGMEFAQDDVEPWNVPFEKTEYFCKILHPDELFESDEGILQATSNHDIPTLGFNSRSKKLSAQGVVNLAAEVAKLEKKTELTTAQIFLINSDQRRRFNITQIEGTPVNINNGKILEVDVLKAMMRAGGLRQPIDFHSPETADPAKLNPPWLIKFDDDGYPLEI